MAGPVPLLPHQLLQVTGLIPACWAPGTAQGFCHRLQGATWPLGSPQQCPQLHQARWHQELETGHQRARAGFPSTWSYRQALTRAGDSARSTLSLSFCPSAPQNLPKIGAWGCPVTSPSRQPTQFPGWGRGCAGLLPPGPGLLLLPQGCLRNPGPGPAQTPGIPGEKDDKVTTTFTAVSPGVQYLAKFPGGPYYHRPHFTNRETEAARGKWACSRSQGWSISGPPRHQGGPRQRPGGWPMRGRAGLHENSVQGSSWPCPAPPHPLHQCPQQLRGQGRSLLGLGTQLSPG